MAKAQGVVAALLGFVAVAAGGANPTFTVRDSGRSVVLPRHSEASLRLTTRWRWTTPRVSGTSVALVRVDYEQSSGFREWELRARHSGTTVVRSTGYPGDRTFVLTLRVP